MKIMNTLAVRHLKHNKRQTLSVLLAIVLAVSMLTAVSALCFSMYGAVSDSAKKAGDAVDDNFAVIMTVFGAILGLLISASAIIVISNAFSIQAAERTKQFGVLKSMGATEKQIKSTIIAESNFLSLVGVPVGMLFGHLLCFIMVLVIKKNMDVVENFTMRVNVWAILISAVLGYLTVLLASLQTANKVSKLSPIEAIRQNTEIQIKGSNLKTPKIVGKIFGFEGTLAYKQIKRSKRKFRVTVISLVCSIVLFLSAFSLGDVLIRTSIGAYGETGANLLASMNGNSADFSKFDNYESMLKTKKIKGLNTLYNYVHSPDKGDWYNIITMNDADYNKFCASAGVAVGSNVVLGSGRTVPFKVSLPNNGGVDFTVTLTANADTVNQYVKSFLMTSYPNIIIPRSEMQRLNLNINASYFITAGNSGALIPQIQPADGAFTSFKIYSIDEFTRQVKRMNTLMMVFVYCFVGMLALIGVTSVFATINSNINLRRPEFATLRAVGMQDKKMYKMLTFESIFYGIQSLLIGLPIGILFSFLIYFIFKHSGGIQAQRAGDFKYIFPYIGVIAVTVGVFVINLIAMFFATQKIRRSNIAETMRELTC